jgi:hypothetical protein
MTKDGISLGLDNFSIRGNSMGRKPSLGLVSFADFYAQGFILTTMITEIYGYFIANLAIMVGITGWLENLTIATSKPMLLRFLIKAAGYKNPGLLF